MPIVWTASFSRPIKSVYAASDEQASSQSSWRPVHGFSRYRSAELGWHLGRRNVGMPSQQDAYTIFTRDY